MLAEGILQRHTHTGTASSTHYSPTARECEIFYALFVDQFVLDWRSPIFRSEPISVAVVGEKQLDWYDEKGLNEIWQAIGAEHAAFAEMGMDDYILNLQQLEEE